MAVPVKNTFKFYFLNIKIIPLAIAHVKKLQLHNLFLFNYYYLVLLFIYLLMYFIYIYIYIYIYFFFFGGGILLRVGHL